MISHKTRLTCCSKIHYFSELVLFFEDLWLSYKNVGTFPIYNICIIKLQIGTNTLTMLLSFYMRVNVIR